MRDRLPLVVHWGEDLGVLDERELRGVALAAQRVAGSSLPPVTDPALIPLSTTGWLGQPGLIGHRDGHGWSPRFVLTAVEEDEAQSPTVSAGVTAATGVHRVNIRAEDAEARLELVTTIEMFASGLLRFRHSLTNSGIGHYSVERLSLQLPVGSAAEELLDMTGRHALERVPVRAAFEPGMRLRESRRGRPGADAAYVTVAGERGFAFRRGRVWGVHLAWSGNQRSFAEHLPTGEKQLGAGELLLPGEAELAPGESYETPWLFASYGERGLDSMSHRFHAYVRGLPHIAERPRPVTFNSWEALSFSLSAEGIVGLAEKAAAAGAERFVIDDGWFGDRRGDRSSLGDWTVSESVFPDGLAPVARRIRELGMEFGIWFEPEMINEDSDLARAHPDWLMRLPDRIPIESRHQQVLDLENPEAWGWIHRSIADIVERYDVGYIKWDHNRDLIDAGTGPSRVAGVRRQTLALYRLLDSLRERFPQLAIESCASGGARVDLGIVERCDRFWTSDSVDPLDRQAIQRWTALVMPPEVLGAHVGAPVAGSTRRQHRLNFRAGTALLGDFGIEWNLDHASPTELVELRRWVALSRDARGLLRRGTLVHADRTEPEVTVTGVVDPDLSEALYVVASLGSNPRYSTGRISLPGLAREQRYRVSALPPAQAENDYLDRPAWIEAGGVELSGATLETIGVEGPVLWPEEVALIAVKRVG